MSTSWGQPPTHDELVAHESLSSTDLAHLLVRALHLRFPLDESIAEALVAVVVFAAAHKDEWIALIAASVKDFATTGRVSLEAAPVARAAAQLHTVLADADTGTSTLAISQEFTLRRAPQLDATVHFQPRPAVVASLAETFRPIEPAPAPSAASAGCAASASASASTSASASASAPAAAAAPRPSVLLGRSRGTAPSLQSGRAGMAPGSKPSSSISASLNLGGKPKRPKMMMMDEGEAAQVLAASQPAPKKPRSSKVAEKKERDPFEGAAVPEPSGLVAYYQDRRKKWKYQTDAVGGALLRGMFELAGPLLKEVRAELAGSGQLDAGKQIYAQKPNLGANGVTWSQDDYANRGLQAEYLRLKSIQRFTEGWAAMQRVYNTGHFDSLRTHAGAAGSVPYRVASLGGGPGFELVALRAFFAKHLPVATPELISLDLATEWKDCAEKLGLRFNEWNVNDGDGLLAAAGWPRIELCVVSYVFYHYMSTEHCYEWMARRLHDGSVGGFVIISRFEDLGPQIAGLERRGVHAVRLMKQPQYAHQRDKTTDHRQLLFLSRAAVQSSPLTVLPEGTRLRTTYPNVPHEDGKDPRDRSYDELLPPDEPGAAGAAGGGPAAAAAEPVDPANLPDEVPEPLREPLRALPAESLALVVAFFRRQGGQSGTAEVVLSTETRKDPASGEEVLSNIVLRLDYASGSWKRVRRKAAGEAQAGA